MSGVKRFMAPGPWITRDLKEAVLASDYDALQARLDDKEAMLATAQDIITACLNTLEQDKARLAEAEATNRHRDRQIAAIVTWLEQNQLDVFRRGLWDVIPRATDSASPVPKMVCKHGWTIDPRLNSPCGCTPETVDAVQERK